MVKVYNVVIISILSFNLLISFRWLSILCHVVLWVSKF